MIRRTALATLALSAALVAGSWGCGPSEEEIAVKRLMDTKAPARIRMVNLSSDPVTMVWQNRPIESNLKPGTFCRFRMLGAGKQEVEFKRGDEVVARISREFDSEKPYTVLLADSGDGIEMHLIDGEMRSPTASTNLSTYYVGLDGEAASVPITLTSEGQSYTVQPDTGDLKLAAGEYVVSGEGVSETDTYASTVEDRGMYSLFIVDADDGTRYAYLIQNNPLDEPAIAAAAAI